MTVLDLVLLAASTFCALAMAALTPPGYRSVVYIILLIIWGIVLLYLAAPPDALDQKLRHWMAMV